MKHMIYANVIADSITAAGERLTTMEVQMHRFVLAEFNTHRMFSRNSASSRAIPIEKQIAKIAKNPAFPLEWGSNKSGMQAGEPLNNKDAKKAKKVWKKACKRAIKDCRKLEDLGVHKQIANRILEPYMWHTVIVSSTEWDNFFEQRCSSLAQPEIRFAALAMRNAYQNSVPFLLMPGEFHLPYLQPGEENLPEYTKTQICIARCARVSYLTHDNQYSVEKDVILFDRLVSAEPPHWSPMEHIATPLSEDLDPSGNFDGYAQVRHNLHLVF
jgi:thymidylate synthase ThyX